MRLFLRFLRVTEQFTRQIFRYVFTRLSYVLVRDKELRRQKIERLRAVCLTDTLRNLGATYIKFGQVMSSRPDLLPPYITDELATLQDRVPPFPFEEVEKTFHEDFGRGVKDAFKDFDPEPIAAASVAQVHEAHLRSGERVAVKVRRPNIEQTVERDLSILRFFAGLVEKIIPIARNMAFQAQVQEFGDAIHAQLDFTVEAENNRRFRANFENVPYVKIPALVEDLCSRRVITMEFIEARKIGDILPDLKIERSMMAHRLFNIYIKMTFEDFFIHADMHPGNILFDDQGNCYMLDVGLVSEVDQEWLPAFMRFNLAISQKDGAGVARTYIEEYKIQPKDYAAFEADCIKILSSLEGKSAAEIEYGKYVLDMFKMIRKHHVHMDPRVTLLNVAYLTFEGMSRVFDPKFDIMDIYAKEIMRIIAQPRWREVFARHFGKPQPKASAVSPSAQA